MKHKEILDISSGGSSTNNTEEEAWNLLETISENTGYWELDKGNEPYFYYGYSCVESFSTSILFKNMSDTFNLDPYVILEIARSFAEHICIPKSGFETYVEPVKQFIVIPNVIKQIEPVLSVRIEEYVEPPPYPNQVKKIYLLLLLTRVKEDVLSHMNRWKSILKFLLSNN